MPAQTQVDQTPPPPARFDRRPTRRSLAQGLTFSLLNLNFRLVLYFVLFVFFFFVVVFFSFLFSIFIVLCFLVIVFRCFLFLAQDWTRVMSNLEKAEARIAKVEAIAQVPLSLLLRPFTMLA